MTKLSLACSAYLLALALSGSPGQTQTPIPASAAPDLKDPEALLAAARASNGLEGDDLKPWHLKATYDVFDPYGKPLATGVFEEWWAGKDKWKRSYTGPHYTGTEYHLPEGIAHDEDTPKNVPWPESLIANQVLSPIKNEKAITLTGDKGPRTLDPPRLEMRPLPGTKPPLSCVVPAPRLNYSGADPFGRYCFEPGKAELRLSEVDYLASAFNKIGTFQGRWISLESGISCNSRPVIRIHISSLSGFAGGDESLFTPRHPVVPAADGTAKQYVGPAVLAGRKIRGENPIYPSLAKEKGEQGVVMLAATINKQGEIEDLQLLESPSELLSDSAMSAVRTWKYQPYLLLGAPVDVRTTVNVIFNLGR